MLTQQERVEIAESFKAPNTRTMAELLQTIWDVFPHIQQANTTFGTDLLIWKSWAIMDPDSFDRVYLEYLKRKLK